MTWLSEIRELKGQHILRGMIGFLAVLGPGFLTLYHYHPELIEKYDVLKLALFSAALTVPVIFLNFIVMLVARSLARALKKQADTEDSAEIGDLLAAAFFLSMAVLYAALVVAYLWRLTFLKMLFVAAGAEVLFGFTAIISEVTSKDKPNTGKQS